MSNDNFNAKELEEITNEINSTESEIRKYIKIIMNAFTSLSGIISSDDSLLSNTCDELYNTYEAVLTKINGNLDNIRDGISTFMNETVNNEEEASHNITNIHSNIENINNLLKDL